MTLQALLQSTQTLPLTAEGQLFVQTVQRQSLNLPRPTWQQLPDVRFRHVDDEGRVVFDLCHDSVVAAGSGTRPLHSLLEAQWPHEQALLIAAVWHCKDCEALAALLTTLEVVVRFSADLKGRIHAHLVSAAFCIRLIRKLQAGEKFLSNGDPVMDALTRSLGIRSKVALLISSPDEAGMAKTLGRLSKD